MKFEQIKPEYKPEKEKSTPIPDTLDVIEIDGRFAQYTGVGPFNIYFLDGGPQKTIDGADWQEYNFETLPNIIDVKGLLEAELISKDEYERVHWGSEQKQYPFLKGVVTFFGKYKKK